MANTEAAYSSLPGGPLDADRSFYDRLAKSAERTTEDRFEIPIRSGRAWEVRAGQVFRIAIVDGPQVADFNIWNRHNPRERMWAARTRQLQSAHVSVYDRLWSTLPYLRPMVTIIADTMEDYGRDSDGGRVHDLLGTRCDPYVNQMLSGQAFDYHCHSNLTRAVLPYGLTEFDVHDVLNIFQCTGLNDADEYFMKTCPARPNDYIEFFAEQDLLCALSTCPGGDLELPMWGPDAATDEQQVEHCHPLAVEVFTLDRELLADWTPPAAATYAGRHGLAAPAWPPPPGRPV
jgi:uncharacterized protein YcgI (DUF1989 family)